jgi:hypothetical protein
MKMDNQFLAEHKLASKLLHRVMDSSNDKANVTLFASFSEENKDDSPANATDGVISVGKENECPEVIV